MNEKTLHEHLFACQQVCQLLLDENRLLKTTGSAPCSEFLEDKRAGLRQLEAAVAALRALHIGPADLTPAHRAIIEKTQQIVLKTMLIDRENEQLLRKCLTREMTVPAVRPPMDHVHRLYSKYTSSTQTAAQ
jgi:hypothetical protein